MNRLTERQQNGVAITKNNYLAMQQLAAYEDTGLEPNEVHHLETIVSELEARLIKEQNARKVAESERDKRIAVLKKALDELEKDSNSFILSMNRNLGTPYATLGKESYIKQAEAELRRDDE